MNGPQLGATGPAAGHVQVHLVSAERLLGSLPDRSIDLAITDPPYVSVNRSTSASGHLRDWFPDGLTWPQIGQVFALARAKLKPDGVLMAMTNNDGLREAIGAMERAGFIGIRTITWDRQYPGLGGGLRHQTEFVLVGRLPGSRTLSGTDLVSVAAVGPGTANRYPTAKPEGLGRKLAAMAGIGPGSLVVDPFCGSGALLVGAAERGATVIGGDVAKRAVRLAGARLAQAGSARGRSRSRQATGQPRPATATRPASAGKPSGSGRSTIAARPATAWPTGSKPARSGNLAAAKPARSGKPSRTSRPTTVTRLAKPAKPTGARPAKPTGARPAEPAKPTGARPAKPTGARPAKPAKPTGSGRSTTATTRATKPRPSRTSQPVTVTRPAKPGKPTGTRRSTTVTRPGPRAFTRQVPPGSRP